MIADVILFMIRLQGLVLEKVTRKAAKLGELLFIFLSYQ